VSEGVVLSTCDGAIGTVTLSSPERRNAISAEMRVQLADSLRMLDEDPAIQVVVVTGAGAAFCAGVDLSDSAPAPRPLDRTKPLTTPFDEFSKPLVAAVNGPAVGGGFEIVLAADIRVASTAAWFALPEVKIGSLPGSGGTQRLTRALPPAVAAELVLTGDRLSAEDAYRFGLVSALVESGELEARARGIAEQVASNAPLSLRAAKLALRAAVDQPLLEGRALERALWGLLAMTDDRAEGRAAFREGRPPRFKAE
jgi:enoyl-CoA hydratase/carnithine racemase